MKNSAKKLQLNRETLRDLMQEAAGGVPILPSDACTVGCSKVVACTSVATVCSAQVNCGL